MENLPYVAKTNTSDYRLNTATNRFLKIGSISYMRAYKAGTIQLAYPDEVLPHYTDEVLKKRDETKKNNLIVKKIVAERLKVVLKKKSVNMKPVKPRRKYNIRKVVDTDTEVYDSSSDSEMSTT